jgi:hypothetical protein
MYVIDIEFPDLVKKSRKEKWERFFNASVVGRDVFEKTKKLNPSWGSVDVVADRVVSLYRQFSDSFHEISHNLNNPRSEALYPLEKLQSCMDSTQGYNFICCLTEMPSISKKFTRARNSQEENELQHPDTE